MRAHPDRPRGGSRRPFRFSLFKYLHDSLKFAIDSLFIDFAHYYTFATVVARGLDPFTPADVAQVDALLHIRRAAGGADYPPLFYLLMRPWTWLPFHAAAILWLLVSQACLAGAVALCIRGAGTPSPVRLTMALFVVLHFQPIRENLALGNSNMVLLLLMTAAWWGLRHDRLWVTALATALVVHIKVQYGLLIPLLWWMGYRQTCLQASALACAEAGAGMAVLGVAHYEGYARLLLTSSVGFAAWIANLSPRAALHRLLGMTNEGVLLADALWIVFAGCWLVVLAGAAANARTRGARSIEWAWGLGAVSVLLLSPMTEEHHMVVVLLPLLLLLLMEQDLRLASKDGALLIGCVVLIGSRYSLDRFPAFHEGVPSLLMTGKILGLLLLAWMLVRRSRGMEHAAMTRRPATARPDDGVGRSGGAFRERLAALHERIGAWWRSQSQSLEREFPVESAAIMLLLALVVSFSAVRYGHILLKTVLTSQFIDFAHYYFYATLVALGLDPFDPQAIAQVEAQLGIRHAMAPANYPPLFYLMMRPWTWMPFWPSAVSWLLLSQACLAGTVVLCLRRAAPVSLLRAGAALFIVLNYQPLVENEVLGQSNIVLLGLLAGAWWGLQIGSMWLTAIALSVVVHIKVQYLVMLPLLWWMGHRRAGAYAALLAAVGVVTGLVFLGEGHYRAYWQVLLSSPDSLVSWTENLSPRAILHRAFGVVEGGRRLADGFWVAGSVAVAVLCAWAIPRSPVAGSRTLDWAWGLGLVAVLLLSPVTEEHHMVVLLLPLVLLMLSEPGAGASPVGAILLLAGVLLLGSLYSLVRFPLFDQGLWSLLETGKSMGVVCLGWVLVSRLRAGKGAAS
jgi:hypothetical protein